MSHATKPGGPRHNPAFLVAAGYALVTIPPLLAAVPGPTGWAIAAAHLTIAGALLARSRRYLRADLDSWLPLLFVPLAYIEIRWLVAWNGAGFQDGVVQRWEAMLFPSNPSRTWAGRWPWLPFSEAVHLGYLAYYPLIYLPQIGDWRRGDALPFHRTVLALTLSFVVCYLVFVVFPVQGPRYLWTPEGVPDGPMRSLTLAVLESGSSRGAAFPSSHVAVAFAQAVTTVAAKRRSAPLVVALTILLTMGTVYGGFHYAVDVVAGAAVGLTAGLVALRVPLGPLAGRGRGRRAEVPDPAPR